MTAGQPGDQVADLESTQPVVAPRGDQRLLVPYVPRLVIEWLTETPEVQYRSITGTGLFVDISGFTNLTERLARNGKVGAEEMSDVLNVIFEQLLGAAYDYGAGLIKWGGDAVLLLFEDEGHAQRACRAAFEMQRVIAKIGRIQTTSGVVRLRMSIGAHSGDLDFLLVGEHFRELIITGPAATTIAQMEKIADAGEIVISEATAALLDPNSALVGEPKAEGFLLKKGPDVARLPSRTQVATTADLSQAFSKSLCEHLLAGTVENEHRFATVCFVEFSGVDELLASEGPEALTSAIAHIVDAAQLAAEANDVTFLSSDIYEDGGKFILISGAPVSSGDDEARILTAARQVVDAGGRLHLKAGVNCGRIFAGDYGPSYRRVYSITGDIVNLAARLMARAGHGEIVVTPIVLERSRTAFETTAMEPFMAKGKTEPIQAVLLGPIIQSRTATGTDLPLIGRDKEMAMLLKAAELADHGEGQVVEIAGDPGTGKSRLLDELVSKSTASLLWAEGDIYGTSTPYQPLQRLFRHQLGLTEDASNAQVAETLTELINDSAPDLVPWLPLIGIVAGVDLPTTDEVDLLDPELRKHKLEVTTSDALGRLLDTPTLFIFNDAHFMDDASLGLIRQLAQDVKDRPWLLVATRRPMATELLSADRATCIELGPLDQRAADQLITAALGDVAMPSHRLQALLERAGGNPLFLRELGTSAAEVGFDVLPDSVEGVISARIDRLPTATRRLLRSASVLGMTIDLTLLEDVLSVDGPLEPGTFDVFNELGEFVTPMGDRQLRFAHNLIRETAYEGLPYRRRSLLHARAADLIEARVGDRAEKYADLLSLHSLHGERFHAAWDYSRVAGDRARDRYANADAADCYRRALTSGSHLPSLDDESVAVVCESLSDVYVDLGEFSLADDMLDRARHLTKDHPMHLARVRLKTASHRSRTGRNAQALQWITRARRDLKESNEPDASRIAAELASIYAIARFHQGNHKEAMAWGERAIQEARACGDRKTEAQGLEVFSVAAATAGRVDEYSRAQEALDLFIELGDLRGQGRAHNVLGMCAYFIGDWNTALKHYREAEEILRRTGREFQAAMNAANSAEILIDQGRFTNASLLLSEAIPQLRGANSLGDLAFAYYLQARIASRNGEYETALATFAEARDIADGIGETYEVLTIDAFVAECLLLSGDPLAAMAAATDALEEVSGEAGVATVVPLLERVRGLALIELGNPEIGIFTLRASLSGARERKAGHEIAATIAALQGVHAARDEAEAQSWREERQAVTTKLGLVDQVPALSAS